ncbi:hypothetical protein RYX36_028763 [Vicia faba]
MRKKSIPYCSFQYPSFYYDSFDDKDTQDLRADQCQNDNAEKQKHECHICRKSFPSQNGLNGHMRIHKKDNKGIPPRPASSTPNIYLPKYLPPRSHKCRKRNYDISTFDSQHFSCDNSHGGDGKRLKLHSNIVDEKIKEQAATPSIGHVNGIDETVKMKVKDIDVEIQDC